MRDTLYAAISRQTPGTRRVYSTSVNKLLAGYLHVDYVNWTLAPLYMAEKALKRLDIIPWYYFYDSFDMDFDELIFKPFWKIPHTEWFRRWSGA